MTQRPRSGPNRGGSRPQSQEPPPYLEAVITKSDQASAKLMVEHAETLGGQLKSANLTTSQIRALFGEVRRIDAQLSAVDLTEADRQQALRRLILLKPKMAYRAHRERGRGVKELTGVLDPAIDLVVRGPDSKENFKRFVEFFEAILAYHRAAGGS